VVTVHDLGYKHFPQAHPPREYRYLDWSTRHSARAAARIMADSAATRADLTAFYAIPPEKIGLVYAGVEDSLGPVTDPAQLAAVRARYGLPERYWLFLGTLQPRKNIARLVQAFEAWRQKSGDESAVLALGGKAGWLYDPAWLAPSRQVQLLGYVADSDRAALYSGALGFVFPSLYEGFGFPVLEAMRCACPVLCANTSSLPELAGEAAVLVDPLSVESIATGMDELLARRDELISRGRAQQARFTWARAAESALAILEDA
jgi:glycosyltransferase involved in cell wall biosynthesis